ncbi:peptidase inhibitor family I36 protein [Streptomyces marokkonensis]|uniref:Peptidase inhibitor family I36 protein n=1 Tax=Streptomyces marokkonensis TaxID=324855 RepID=A0ABW6Q918_9ACTN
MVAVLFAVGLLALGLGKTAPPAAAAEECPAERLCLYSSTELRGLKFAAASTKACFWLGRYGLGEGTNGVNSYVNNLPVTAQVYQFDTGPGTSSADYTLRGSIRAGGASSNTGAVDPGSPWHQLDKVCTGGADPMTSPAFVFGAEYDADPLRYADVPGTKLEFDATQGQSSYLWTRNVSVGNVSALGEHKNVGVTTAIRCSYADGRALPTDKESGAYWAANLVPPGETVLTPSVRWTFVAPTTDRYRCRVSVLGYASWIGAGNSVAMQVEPGAELARAVHSGMSRWTLADATEPAALTPGSTQSFLDRVYVPQGSERIAIVMDTNMTSCNNDKDGVTPNYGIDACAGAEDPVAHYTNATTWIEAQPLRADGSTCGAPLTSALATWHITERKHHQTATNTLYLGTSQLGACDRLRVALKVSNTSGNRLQVHSGYISQRIARTHATAFTY